MSTYPDQDAKTASVSDDMVFFADHGIQHAFQHESGDSSDGRENGFLRLNFVAIYVWDQERSKRFFVDRLGFRLMIDVQLSSGYRWVEVAPPDGTARIALIVPATGSIGGARPGESSLLTFLTEDVEAKYREWSDGGVKFTTAPYIPEWGGMFCQFEDPDGNPLGLASFNEVARALEARREAEVRRREAQRFAVQELEIARQVQTRLLPQTFPAIPTLDCAGVCLQARVVGGDYYDFIELAEDRLGIVVSDIAGKGIGAALLMASLQATLRSQSTRLADQPERALTLINRTLFEITESGAYATLFYAEYNSTSCRLRYANCGHLPGLLLRGTEIERLGAANTVIGLLERWECLVAETVMVKGETLVLYTDGVTEAMSDSEEEFGETRLINIILRHSSLSARAIAAAIAAEVVSFGRGKQHDDITVVVMKVIA